MQEIIRDLRDELRKNAVESVRESGQRYFKEPFHIYTIQYLDD